MLLYIYLLYAYHALFEDIKVHIDNAHDTPMAISPSNGTTTKIQAGPCMNLQRSHTPRLQPVPPQPLTRGAHCVCLFVHVDAHCLVLSTLL